MVAYRIIGDNLVSDEEFHLKQLDVKLAQAANSEHVDRVMLANGFELDFRDAAVQPLAATTGQGTPLPEIGYGKPLTIELLRASAGELGSPGSQIAVLSAVRSWGTTNAAARALNYVSRRAGPTDPLPMPSAFDEGTTVVAYQKAVTSRQINAAFQMGAASKFEEVATVLRDAFGTASRIPLLLPYSGILMAASKVIPLAGKFLSSIAEGRMAWSSSFEINLGRPTAPVTVAQKMIVATEASGLGRQYRYRDTDGALVDAAGAVYKGMEPYAVVAVHGSEDSELEHFTPAVASAEMLRRFHAAQQGGGLVEDLLDALRIASDVKFRSLALRARARMKAADPASKDYATAKAEFDAAVKNIQDEDLKPAAD